MNGSGIDLSELRLLFEDEPDELASFCREIADAVTVVSAALVAAFAAGHAEPAREKAHELRGLLGNVGARALAERCAAFERAIREDTPTAAALVPDIVSGARDVCAALVRG